MQALFFKKHTHVDPKMIAIEKEEITAKTNEIVEKVALLVNSDEIVKTFYKHFPETVERLHNSEQPSNTKDLSEETLTKIIKKFKKHSSIIKIKSKYLIQEAFSFQPVFIKDVEKIIKNIPSKKTP